MKNFNKVIATTNYKMQDHTIISFIKHDLEGLRKETKLKSIDGRVWIVFNRIIPFQVSDKLKRFASETESFIHYSFKNRAEIEKNLNRLIEQETELGFQYTLIPFEHSDKPLDGEELTPVWE